MQTSGNIQSVRENVIETDVKMPKMLKLAVKNFNKDILTVFHHRFKKLMDGMENIKKRPSLNC